MLRLLRLLASLLLGILVLGGGMFGYGYYHRDALVQRFVAEANRHLAAEVAVGEVALSWWAHFPRMSVRLRDVRVAGSLPDQPDSLASLAYLDGTFDFWQLWRGQYTIDRLTLAGGTIHVCEDERGTPNYRIFRPDTTASDPGSVTFDLRRVVLRDVVVRYTSAAYNQAYHFYAEDARARLRVDGPQTDIALEGTLRTEGLRFGQDTYLTDQPLALDVRLRHDAAAQTLRCHPSEVHVGTSAFEVAGTVALEPAALDLTVNAPRADLVTLVSLLPERYARPLRAYRSKGPVSWRGTLQGPVHGGQAPAIETTFSAREVTFYHPDLKQRVSHLTLEGHFHNGAARHLRTAALELRDVRARLGDHALTGYLRLQNLVDPTLRLRLDGTFDVAALTAFYPLDGVSAASGTATLSLSLDGRAADLSDARTVRRVRTTGELTLQNLQFDFGQKALPFRAVAGELLFNNDDVAVNALSGYVGRSDLALNGAFRNLMPYLLTEHEPLYADVALTAGLIDLDELLSATGGQESDTTYRFTVSPRLAFDVRADVREVRFRRFRARVVSGALRQANQIITADRLRAQAFGGTLRLDGTLDARRPADLRAQTRMQFTNLRVDSAFFAFEDFGQRFLTHRHLRGRANADITATWFMDDQLRLDDDRLRAEADVTVREGALLDFAPLQALSRFLDEDALTNLRFATLQNRITVGDRTVTVPRMSIRSNAANLSVAGTHTFDQRMDYRLEVPVQNLRRRPDPDAAFGTIRAARSRGGNLLLTLRGTNDDFRIGYDREALGEKLRQGWQREKEELRNLEMPADTTAPEADDEYFDF